MAEKFNKRLLSVMLAEWKWIGGYIYRYKITVAVYIVLGLVASGISVVTAVASKYLIDAVLTKDSPVLIRSAAAVASMMICQILFQALSSRVTAVLSTRVGTQLRDEMFSRVVRADWEKIGSFHSGELLNRLEGDVNAVASGVTNYIPAVISKALTFVLSFAVVLYYDRVMALIALMSAPFFALSSRFLTVAVRKYSKETRETNGRVLSFSEEALRGLQTVKTFDLTVRMIGLFRDLTASYREVRLKYEKFNIIMTAVVSFLGMMVSCACYGWAVYRLWQGLITVGTMMLFLQISGSLSSSFSGLTSLAPSAVSIATSAGRIMEITGFESEKDADGARAEEVLSGPACGAEIRVENVSFNYSGTGRTVLKDITLDARPGERIAVIGGSGNGKTTLLKLLLGLLRPSSGKLTLSYCGEEFSVSDSTRRFFSYVPQEATLFSGTLEFNLRLAAPDADDESLRKALRLACMDAFVDSQPDGLAFEVGENGGNLSKGQQQRLLIARALLKDAPVLLLDEATSALDPDTERAVLTNIMKDDPNRTVILTTHKKSVLSYCTRVLRISADGSLAPAER